MFLSILVAAYWLSRCRNTCRRGKQQLTRLEWPQDSISFSHPIACTSKKARFEALCAAATLPLYLKLATLTMDTWYSQNIIFVLYEKKTTIIAGAVLQRWRCMPVDGSCRSQQCVNWDWWKVLLLSSTWGRRFPWCFSAQGLKILFNASQPFLRVRN